MSIGVQHRSSPLRRRSILGLRQSADSELITLRNRSGTAEVLLVTGYNLRAKLSLGIKSDTWCDFLFYF